MKHVQVESSAARWNAESPFPPTEADESARLDADLVRAARAEEVCDAASQELRTLGSQLLEILDHLEGFLPELVEAANRYDEAVARHLPSLITAGTPSPRFESPVRGRPTLDGVDVKPCRADRHLLGRLALTLRALGGDDHFIRDAGLYNAAAPQIPQIPRVPPPPVESEMRTKGRKS